MKRLIVGDLHFGVNEKNESYLDYQDKSLKWIRDVSNEYNLKCDFLGDFFDNPTQITLISMKRALTFINSIYGLGNVIIGNHDCYYKNTNDVNSPSLLFQSYDKDPSNNILYLDWINKENLDITLSTIKKSKLKYCLGHLELEGFLLQKDIYSKEGSIDIKKLKKFDLVISGHYHKHSKKGNVIYLGTPFEVNFSDTNESKYIMILDDETGEYELIQNPYSYFVKIDINSNDDLITPTELEGKKVNINLNCERTIVIENWLNELNNINVDFKVIDVKSTFNDDFKVDNPNEKVYDVWKEYINTLELNNIDQINNLFEEEYLKVTQ